MQILYFAYLREYTGCKQEAWPPAPDVRSLLEALCAKHGAPFRQKIYKPGSEGVEGSEELGDVIIMVNGRHIDHLGGLATALRDSDTVQIFPVVAGG